MSTSSPAAHPAAVTDWVAGDMLGLQIPARSEALYAGGPSFLTEAFRASGALAVDNSVLRITRFEEWPGGSTGRKALLSVKYAQPASGLHTDLFVKFSRDFADPMRDRGRRQMESEVRFAALSRKPEFPIAVPSCLFADYHQESGSGILITQRIAFGTGVVEPHYPKCRDYSMPAPMEHYEAIIKALARLAGTDKAGRFPERIVGQFPFDSSRLNARIPYTTAQLQDRVTRFADFATRFPQLLPHNLTRPTFLTRLAAEVGLFPKQEAAIKQDLQNNADLIALCHWNANVDNAWFWRDARGELQCGLLDWGNVSRMNVAMALWGALSAAEIDLWDRHIDGLLTLFIQELCDFGGPHLDIAELTRHLHLYILMMGLGWLLDSPAVIQAQMPDLHCVLSRFDPRFEANETARVQLHMLTTFLNLWDTRDFGHLLQE
jgi:hypothetical protein